MIFIFILIFGFPHMSMVIMNFIIQHINQSKIYMLKNLFDKMKKEKILMI